MWSSETSQLKGDETADQDQKRVSCPADDCEVQSQVANDLAKFGLTSRIAAGMGASLHVAARDCLVVEKLSICQRA